MTLYQELLKREAEDNPIKVGVIGAGQMGFGMISQIASIPGMIVTGISDINLDNARLAKKSFLDNSDKANKILTSTDFREVVNDPDVEVLVDATGVTEVGAKLALETLVAKKNLVLLNVEIDVTIGPLMKRLYDAADLVYTGSDGDEPAVTTELFEFAKSLGMKVLVAGKGKNNKNIHDANPDTVREEAEAKHMSPHMLAAFQDGTKTMAEMTLLSNATGLIPDTTGMHGISGDLDQTVEKLDLKDDGGVLNNFGVVEYVNGIAPGVFVIVEGQNEGVKSEMDYLMKKGTRKHHILYRPFHLASLETPLTIAKAVLNHDHAIVPIGAPVSETIAVAKRDIKVGEKIDGIGGYSVRGVIETHKNFRINKHVPIGLITGNTIAKQNINKGEAVVQDAITLDSTATVVKLRALQDEVFAD
ncbi:NAD(P)H-dependent oxidoreductase [Lacticaseibacillus paracasei]|uniref:SAF domain-containing protein n=1 Tax=Lacticaseibacillus paracasei TaxID=1597 RepID=A0ABD5D181_LACPA|nr:SAF domain-containing protein [Lacticaseibacillus paracasei]EPC88969.1 oxidoreductase [Lacticaseibacillus paracasei subsp. paracasei CNCM I-4649]MDR7625478.1 SAF domain-containing protein [Lacticaseibacillus paracasei]QPC12923.1 NAD(P)-dependent oxidoreductase [Lacticaseibacillus paracasei subsp. tolerans]QUS98209.1 NAD(P)-dependent oxidoreductase [Lacticaseibacillus paracasei subsp. tolerans]WMX60015.1 SAF domain-containing protein [Lacticaseibacillus paracasei]